MMVTGVRGVFKDWSGTITTGGTSQVVVPPNPMRNHLLIQNNHTAAIWFDFGKPSVQSQPSIQLIPNGVYEMPSGDFIETSYVSINGPTGAPFTVKEA